jgi:hypothetical protein
LYFTSPFGALAPKRGCEEPLRDSIRVARWFIFKPKIPILEGLGIENVIFYDHFEYFMAIWYNLWQFGIVCGHLVHFSHFGTFGPRKIWQPWIQFDGPGDILS